MTDLLAGSLALGILVGLPLPLIGDEAVWGGGRSASHGVSPRLSMSLDSLSSAWEV